MKSLTNITIDNRIPAFKKFPKSIGNSVAETDLFILANQLNGNILKCGINKVDASSGLTYLTPFFKNRKIIVFEKSGEENGGNDGFKNTPWLEIRHGNLINAAEEYLIENPELKLAYLSIDLDNYESTISALEYFYPRIVENGILVIANYYKKTADFQAVRDYFYQSYNLIKCINEEKGPHFLVKN